MRLDSINSHLNLALLSLLIAAGTVHATTTLKIATVAPEGSQWMQDMRVAAKQISQRTDERVKIKFYGGGVMGNDKKVLRKIRIGQLQGGVFTANGLADRYRDIVLYGLPMVFRSQDEVDYVRERMDPILAAGLEEAGFVSFGFAGGGFAKLMGQEPVTRLEDLRGRKVWVPEGDQISYEAMRAMDLSPVVLPITDVLTGLQTGLLEYIATPPVGAVILQWYTKVKYVTAFPFAYTLGFMAIDKRAFSRIGDPDQAIVREVMTDVYRNFEETNKADNEKAEEALAANGLQFTELDAEMIPQWRQVVAEINERLGEEGVFSSELRKQLLAYLEEFRTGAELISVPVSASE
jgi:TRAP-type C4-dicarboxylate transport system substrate-binding protein